MDKKDKVITAKDMDRTVKFGIIISGIIFLLIGIISGFFITYYALPSIHYDLTVQPGVYTFDIGPTAAGVFGQIYTPTNYTSTTTKVLEHGTIPVPNTQWEEVPANPEYYALDPNMVKAVPWEQANPKVIINTNCYQPVICPCAMNTTQPCMLACYEWINNTGC